MKTPNGLLDLGLWPSGAQSTSDRTHVGVCKEFQISSQLVFQSDAMYVWCYKDFSSQFAYRIDAMFVAWTT